MTQKILALETSETAGSIALQEWDMALSACVFDCEKRLDPKSRSAQSLAPLLDHQLREVGWSAKEITTIGISIGPGSFTGLRVGLATAQAIGYVTHAKLVTVDTRDAIAEAFFAAQSQNSFTNSFVVVWVDAQRGQVVTAVYQSVAANPVVANLSKSVRDESHEPNTFDCLSNETILEPKKRCRGWRRIAVTDHPISINDAVAEIVKLTETASSQGVSGASIWLAGSVLSRPAVLSKLPSNIILVPEVLRSPTARAVATLTTHKIAVNEYADLWKTQPFYSRPSAAEERRTQQNVERDPMGKPPAPPI